MSLVRRVWYEDMATTQKPILRRSLQHSCTALQHPTFCKPQFWRPLEGTVLYQTLYQTHCVRVNHIAGSIVGSVNAVSTAESDTMLATEGQGESKGDV